MMSRVIMRGLATKAVKPPVVLFGVDGTYANALYSASVQDSSIEKAYDSLTKINDLLEKDPKVAAFLVNPALSQSDRTFVIDTIAQNLKLDKPIINFLTVLSDNNRLGELKSIYEKFGVLNEAHQGIVEAKITSAKPLDSKILRRLQTAIGKSSFVGQGKTLKVSNEVNPDVLGGLVVEVGDRTVDLSIASKVSKLNHTLSEAL